MQLFPAIDLFEGKAVRLLKGDYNRMTVYSEQPTEVAESFVKIGAQNIHVVDLEGAKSGTTPNFEVVKRIAQIDGLSVEIGGGIRSEEVIEKYISAGVSRVILGTIAVTNPQFLERVVREYSSQIDVAVGVDILEEKVAIKGWTELSEKSCFEFCDYLEGIGVKTVICTDVSKDGLLSGANTKLYRDLVERFTMKIIASGGVTTLDDVKELRKMNIYGAILGKTIYEGKIDLGEALEVAK